MISWLFLLFLECLLKNILCVLDSDSEGSEFSDISACEDDVSLHTDTDMEDLCGELSRMPEDVTFPQQQTASTYEVEDWDKELEESECSPYGKYKFTGGSFEFWLARGGRRSTERIWKLPCTVLGIFLFAYLMGL